jgi:DNA polymerase I-like protein with 3'-5' exonuclease and polymerase domains
VTSARTLWAEGQRSLFVPESSWKPPQGPLPMLSGIDIGLDTETYDRGLAEERGPGWVDRNGKLCGVSVAWADQAIYVPVSHPETECRPLPEVITWVEYLFRHCRVHFFNIGYDVGWLQASGCRVWPERAEDGGTMAFIADENHQSYSLDACCARAGILGKDETLLREAAAAAGIHKNIKAGIHRLPARYVGPYAEQDAASTLQLCKKLWPTLVEEETVDAYRTEMNLYPVTNAMRRRGIRVSEAGVRAAQDQVRLMEEEVMSSITVPWRGGCTIEDLRSAERLSKLFDEENIAYPRTAKTNAPSFQAQWLDRLTHPLGRKVRRARQLHDLHEKFLGFYILDYETMGRVHAEIRQLRAVTHRFSYSNPPLQQMPSRDEVLAPLVRNAFLPEEGQHWLSADFKSQEPRLNVHYAYKCRKHARRAGINMGDIEGVVHYYRTDPDPDFHTLGARVLGLSRREAKDLNQGLTYRMSAGLLAVHLNKSPEEAERLWNLYHARIPYISGISKFAEKCAKDNGHVRMIDGARRHYPLWQPKHDRVVGGFAYREEAERRWPNQTLERAFAYQAGNSVIQGSAARQVKRAMVAIYRAGITPLVTLHDEIGASVSSAREVETIGELMIDAVKLVMPVTVDLEIGPTWGKAKTDYRKVFA